MRGARFSILILFLLVASAAYGAEAAWLDGLDASHPAALCQAQERFLSQFPAASQRQAKAMFELWHFYNGSVRASQDTFEALGAGLPEEQLQELASALRAKTGADLTAMQARFPILKERMAPWTRCGYVITVNFDDTPMLNPDPLFLRNFENRLMPELSAYIELFLKESPNRLEYDGALAIPWDRLRSRIGRWERFRRENRLLQPLVTDIDRQLKIMFEEYLCGAPNSLVVDDKGHLDAAVRDSYEQFLRVNPDSRQYALVASALRTWRQHDWCVSQELVRLYESHGYSTEFLRDYLGESHR